jgi:hypothetical protein
VRAAALRTAELEELLATAQLALLHVGAAREGAAGAAQDRDLRRLVGVEAVQRLAQAPTSSSLKAFSFSGRFKVRVTTAPSCS